MYFPSFQAFRVFVPLFVLLDAGCGDDRGGHDYGDIPAAAVAAVAGAAAAAVHVAGVVFEVDSTLDDYSFHAENLQDGEHRVGYFARTLIRPKFWSKGYLSEFPV